MTSVILSDNRAEPKPGTKSAALRKARDKAPGAATTQPSTALSDAGAAQRETKNAKGGRKQVEATTSLSPRSRDVLLTLVQGQKRKSPPASSTQRAGKSTSASAPAKLRSPGGKKDWEPIATFVVEYQVRSGKNKTTERRTQAHHHEASLDKQWTGFVQEELDRWMMDRLSEKLEGIAGTNETAETQSVAVELRSDTASRQSSKPEVMAKPAISAVQRAPDTSPVWASRICFLQAGRSSVAVALDEDGECRPATIGIGTPFVIEVVLAPTAVTDMGLTARKVSGVRGRAYDRDMGVMLELGQSHLADRERPAPGILHLHVSPFTSAGSYRLECIPLVGNLELPGATVRIPLLQVINR